mmetsp:Transcript_23775/g.50549  ORF Transcript_23775/g.50549 Transcript_23775/m.50549 type:complete len:769 (-) Transcript_23775:133-2439(-)|eukprot:CAMPEP_0201126006 /NCGR_PEP_ID=MMETSP0850-20130426/24205_1 /ASSEMBLY_ACC=CAM_ASM_000622 /TAXON_ID=183588 /ORGANISM="Pseudo-nitzschia fraudulenta, Strain WWA7" /LENGTH=768 /DNA_ID=CAMNT_0047394251 /DNA_START=240 /DNA_END=2546 /DNA_ORIENTATION=-
MISSAPSQEAGLLAADTAFTEPPKDDFCDDATSGDLESSRNQKFRSGRAHQESIVVETPFGVTLCGKYQIRAAVQAVTLGALLMGYAVFHAYSSSDLSSASLEEEFQFRLLEEVDGNATLADGESEAASEDPCTLDVVSTWWMTAIYIFGILYMFLALAIVCDEFFVPALEELSGPRRMNLSMDVAGATLMAAGGSAPELATSLIGTFRQSEIGFGTIVGSAVFNILFVIGMCSLLAKEVLSLTWWPLFRDSTYYTLGLVLLAVFSGFYTKGEIELWESCVLFSLYIGYCLLMWQNQNLYTALTGKTLEYPDEDEDDDDGSDNRNGLSRQSNGSGRSQRSIRSVLSAASVSSRKSHVSAYSNRVGSDRSTGGQPHFLWQGNFRAGILKLLKNPDSWVDTAGTGMVAKIIGDADYVFEQVDKDGNGHIDREELKNLFELLECHVSDEELNGVFQELDSDGDGEINRKEFSEWYCRSEERIMSQVRDVFDQIDVDKSDSLDREELKTLLATLDPLVKDEDVQSALSEMHKHGDPNEISFDEFSEWYKKSMIYEKQKQLIEDDIQGVYENLSPPMGGGFRDWVWYLICLPLVLVLTLTIVDVQRPGNGKWCVYSFFVSIAWIGGFSYFMVDWAELVGNSFGIPAELMGLTVLAAGTSVPDLLSSVIVARRGQGDMAVSSSVGSNIFDILVGLPVPWLIYSAVNKGEVISIGADGLVRSLLILIGMLVLVIASIHCQGWKLTKVLGGIMFFFYIAFLVQAVVLELPFTVCGN